MNSRQRRKRKRFSERMFQTLDMSRTMEMIWARAGRPVLKLTLDKSQPVPPLVDVKDWDVTVEVVK